MTSRSALLIVLAGLATPVASAQNALDRNLQRGSGGINPSRPSFSQELAFRNAVVTGNAPGGMSFRGNVGYRAPGEFFGNLGSNETFSFRRDSFYSGLGGLGIRGTDALQYQFAMTTGNAPPRDNLGIPTLRRSGTGTTSGLVSGASGDTAASQPSGFSPSATRADLAAGNFGGDREMLPMRSPSAYISSRSLQPTLLGTAQDQDGQAVGITASSLRGISVSPLMDRPRPETPGAESRPGSESPATPDSRQPGVPAPRPERPEAGPLAAPSTAVNQAVDSRSELSRNSNYSTAYDQVLARMRGPEDPNRQPEQNAAIPGQPTRPTVPGQGQVPGQPATAQAADNRSDFQRRLDELRAQIDPSRQTAPGTKPVDPNAAPDKPAAEPGAVPENPTDFRPETIDMLKEGGEVKNLAPEGFDAYATAMKAAQEHLAAGRYFDAESRFTTALGAKPGDPMAAAGRVNAELGAGMFLSAALNLRTLLTQNPEVTGVKYGANVFPAKDRIPPIKDRLRALLTEREGKDADLGLLLAFVGYQTADADAISTGIAAMNTAPDGDPARRLASLLQRVWTAKPATAPAPNPNPPAPAPAPTTPPPAAPNK